MKIAIALAAIFTCTQVHATEISLKQPLPISQKLNSATTFLFFRGNSTPHGFNLQWKLASTAGVKSFIIESTYEFDPTDPYCVWQTEGIITLTNGINKFTATSPYPGIINYRVTAVDNNNINLAVSDIITTTIQ